MEADLINAAYRALCEEWESRSAAERSRSLDGFKIFYSYNSGHIENPEITYHDTAEVFNKGGVSNFTGDIRTIYEMNNLKRSWEWLMEAVEARQPVDIASVLHAHKLLTAGTYDEDRWAKGERPGTFKRGDYRVANDVGLAPDEVEPAIDTLFDQLTEAMAEPNARRNALTIAAYAHARLVEIHPFADGNGRTARLLMNQILLLLDAPPCNIDADDRLAYFGALDCFHEEGDLDSFRLFLKTQTLKTWE